jgi:hypothetical protein
MRRFRPLLLLLLLGCFCFTLPDLAPSELGDAADGCDGGSSATTTGAGGTGVIGLSACLSQNAAPTIVSSIAAQTAQTLHPALEPVSVCFGSGTKMRPHFGHLVAK